MEGSGNGTCVLYDFSKFPVQVLQESRFFGRGVGVVKANFFCISSGSKFLTKQIFLLQTVFT